MIIEEVHIRGYKTIKDLKVSLQPGLNIIIGDNGAGKTNFLSFLNALLRLKIKKSYSLFHGEIIFNNGWRLSVENLPSVESSGIVYDSDSAKYSLTNSSKAILAYPTNVGDVFAPLRDNHEPVYFPKYTPHGSPRQALFLNIPFSGTIDFDKDQPALLQILELFDHNPNNAYQAVFTAFMKLGLATIVDQDGMSKDTLERWKKFLDDTCKYFLGYFKKCTAISDMRISESFAVELDGNRVSVSGMFFEFYQNERWNDFQELSDGTRRILTVIFNLVDYKSEVEKLLTADLGRIGENVIVFLEEPELGIHPHQLYKLMLIIQEESRNKQIIITTHNPQALDLLGKEDLQRIILTKYNATSGTTMRHLDSKEEDAARNHMENVGYLSLHWLHSNLDN